MNIKTVAAVLAFALVNGEALAADPPATYGDAMRWYERAAAEGSAEAQFLLGRMHEQGAAGRPRDPARAAALYREAAEQGHALAQFSLGLLYQHGRGVPADAAEAAKWFEAAAQEGLPAAQFNLGYLHDRGNGVPQNREAAEGWYRAAAQQGLTRAMVNLGLLLAEGGEADRGALIDAWAWLAVAAARGEPGARRIADDIAEMLAADEKSRAEAAFEERRKAVPER
jgi:uncharacterized protein